jgi:hypothetical protein
MSRWLLWRSADEPVSALADRSRNRLYRGGIGRLQQGGTGGAHYHFGTYRWRDVDVGGDGFGDRGPARVGIADGTVDDVEY